MNQLLDFLNSHVSVRQFTGREISPEDELMIITTAQRSPTSSNLQTYTVIGIRSQATKDRLAVLCGNQAHIANSSLFLVFCADLCRLSRINHAKGYQFVGDYTELGLVATVDTALAAGRALMAAQALGMGGVMVGSIRNHPHDVTALLELPEFTFAVMGMSLGYPETIPPLKPRLPLEGIYCREKYSAEKFDAAVAAYDGEIDRVGHLKGREVQRDKYPEFAGRYSWSEHSARRLADTTPTVLRPFMRSYLESQKMFVK
jgi:nitroreductase